MLGPARAGPTSRRRPDARRVIVAVVTGALFGAHRGALRRLVGAARVPRARRRARRARRSSTSSTSCCRTGSCTRSPSRSLALLALGALGDDDLGAYRPRAARRRRSRSSIFFVLHLVSPRSMGFGDVKLVVRARPVARLARLGRGGRSACSSGSSTARSSASCSSSRRLRARKRPGVPVRPVPRRRHHHRHPRRQRHPRLVPRLSLTSALLAAMRGQQTHLDPECMRGSPWRRRYPESPCCAT